MFTNKPMDRIYKLVDHHLVDDLIEKQRQHFRATTVVSE